MRRQYGARSSERSNVRNDYRHRDFDTRAGTLDVAIPKLRTGSYFPDWLLQRRRRAERALTTVVASCYLLGSPPGGWRSSWTSLPTSPSSGRVRWTPGPTRSSPPTPW